MSEKNQSESKKERKIVFPSAKIAVEEEFVASTGTYIGDHEVRAAVFGEQYIDEKYYKAKVYPFSKGLHAPRRYHTVIGQVIKVSKSNIRLNISVLEGKPAIPSYSAILHISDASQDYIRNIDNHFATGDIVRAQVIDSKSIPLQLECKKSNLGVIASTCDRCGEDVKKLKRNSLKCTVCGWKQSRETAIDFGKVRLS